MQESDGEIACLGKAKSRPVYGGTDMDAEQPLGQPSSGGNLLPHSQTQFCISRGRTARNCSRISSLCSSTGKVKDVNPEERGARARFGRRCCACRFSTMVKISFQQPVAGLKPEKEKAAAGNYEAKSEMLLPQQQDAEAQPLPLPMQNRRPFSRIFYLTMILMLLLLGLVLTSIYIYRYFSVPYAFGDDSFEDELSCGVIYFDDFGMPLELHESVKIHPEENYERISVPVPDSGESDPADIIHDFHRGLTAYNDMAVDKCYITELNTTIVMQPQSFWELLINEKKGIYLPQTYIIQEEMTVTEQITDLDQFGTSIYHLCHDKETYWVRRSTTRRYIHRRAAEKCHHIHHFENTFVVDTAICPNF